MAQTIVAASVALFMGWIGFGAALAYAPTEIGQSSYQTHA
jgi:hypothetical protein